MNIETLQIKRVTDHWDSVEEYVIDGETLYGHKNYIPKKGELVWIAPNVVESNHSGCIVMGIGDEPLEGLIQNNNCIFIPLSTISNNLESGFENKSSNNKPNSITSSVTVYEPKEPSDIINLGDGYTICKQLTDASSSSGESTYYSRADHTHEIGREAIWHALDVNTDPFTLLTCRRIMYGTDTPNDSDVIKKLNKMVDYTDYKPFPGDIYIQLEG